MALARIRLIMHRPDLDHLPDTTLPGGYRMQRWRPGDMAHWAAVETAAGEFAGLTDARNRFDQDFGTAPQDLGERCLLLWCGQEAVGTAMAWFGELDGVAMGRLHWVGIIPNYQHRGLAKPLVSSALRAMRRWHTQAYLTTQTTSYRAVQIYLDLGFLPVDSGAEAAEGWRLMRDLLPRPQAIELY